MAVTRPPAAPARGETINSAQGVSRTPPQAPGSSGGLGAGRAR